MIPVHPSRRMPETPMGRALRTVFGCLSLLAISFVTALAAGLGWVWLAWLATQGPHSGRPHG